MISLVDVWLSNPLIIGGKCALDYEDICLSKELNHGMSDVMEILYGFELQISFVSTRYKQF